MKNVRALSPLVVLCGVMLSGYSQAQDTSTTLYIAHGAPGRNFGSTNGASSTNNPSLPIDISVNGNCIVKGLTYGEIGGPYVSPGGSYDFQVSMANTVSPCSGSVVYTAPAVAINGGTTNLGVITLDASNNLVGQIYPIDLMSVPNNQARVVVVNSTQGPVTASVSTSAGTGTLSIQPSSMQEGTVIEGIYTASVNNGAGTQVAGPLQVNFENRDLYIFVIAGSDANQSVQLIGPKIIYGVF